MAQEFKALFCMLGLAFFLSQSMHSCLAAENNNGMKLSRRLSVIHERLRAINKPPIKSIQSSDGDVIDCILRHQQLGLEHPMLKNHKIKDLPTRPTSATKATGNRSYAGLNAFQIWHLSGISCPEGTIPVRRTTVNDLMRFDSLEKYGRKPKYSNISSSQKPTVISGNGHKHAIAYLKGGAATNVYGQSKEPESTGSVVDKHTGGQRIIWTTYCMEEQTRELQRA